MSKQLLAILSAISVVSACAQLAKNKTESSHTNAVISLSSAVPYSNASSASTSDIQKQVDGMNAFGVDFFLKVLERKSSEKANLLLSPLSLQTAFELLYPSVKPASSVESEMIKGLGFSGDRTAFYNSTKGYLIHLSELFGKKVEGARFSWSLNNQVWVDKKYSLQAPFLDTIKTFYNSGVKSIDLSSSPAASDAAVETINDFVADSTNQLIKNLLPPKSFDQSSILTVTNSVYLLADWATPFKAELTHKEVGFTTEAGTALQVETMYREGTFDYMETSDYQAISLPYVGGDIAMLVILPTEASALGKVNNWFSAEALQKILQAQHSELVRLWLPKFKFAWGSEDLSSDFRSRGLQQVFHKANNFQMLLSGCEQPDPCETRIKAIYHKAAIVVDEKGTEAAAATAILIENASSVQVRAPFKEMRVNHPALLVIYEKRYGGVLFIGKLADPSSK